MKYLFQAGIVFGVCLLGELLSKVIPIPTSVLSMVLLFVLLLLKWIKPRHIEHFGNFLLKNMAFFFIPAGVAIMEPVSYTHLRGRTPKAGAIGQQ